MKIFILLFYFLSFAVHANITCNSALESYESCLSTSSETECQNLAINSYTSYLYGSINAALRGFLPSQDCVSLSKIISKGLIKLPSEAATLYRGTRPFPALKNLSIGDCFADNGFMSTSANIWIADSFGADLLTIETKTARSVSHLSWSPGEEEFLILPNTQLKLLEKKAESPYRDLYHFREVDASECPNL